MQSMPISEVLNRTNLVACIWTFSRSNINSSLYGFCTEFVYSEVGNYQTLMKHYKDIFVQLQIYEIALNNS